MSWFKWLLVVYFCADAIIKIARIGKTDKPLTPKVAVGTTIINGLLVAGVIHLA